MKAKTKFPNISKEILDEVKHLQKTKIPRCYKCKKNFVNAYDSITKKKSKYLWKPDCKCYKESVIMARG